MPSRGQNYQMCFVQQRMLLIRLQESLIDMSANLILRLARARPGFNRNFGRTGAFLGE